MKIITKEIKKSLEYLVYLTTDDGINVKCELCDANSLEQTIIDLITEVGEGPLPFESKNYEEYINQYKQYE